MSEDFWKGYAPEPVAARDAIVVNLVREGINKHRARELADHFIGLAAPQPAQQPAQQEPVYVQTRHMEEHGFSEWGSLLDPKHRNSKWAEGVEMRLLYTSPPAQRKPLDAGEISRLWKQHTSEDGPHLNPYDDDGLGFARAIEAAHDIKEKT